MDKSSKVSRRSEARHRDRSPFEITNGLNLRLGKTVGRIDTGLCPDGNQISATKPIQNHGTTAHRANVELASSHRGNDRTGAPGNKERRYLQTVFLEELFFYGNPKRSGRTCKRRIGNDHFTGFRGIDRGAPENNHNKTDASNARMIFIGRFRLEFLQVDQFNFEVNFIPNIFRASSA